MILSCGPLFFNVFSISSFTLIDYPTSMQQTTIQVDGSRSGVYFTTLSWTPTAADQGTIPLCVEATDAYLYV